MSTLAPPHLDAYIEPDPEHPDDMRIAGTGISLLRLAARYQAGEGVEDFIASYPRVPAAAFYAAFAYYLDNRERVNEAVEALERRGLAAAERHAGSSSVELI